MNLVSGVAHPSNPTGALTAGSYAFRATYNGDTNYNVSTSGCEPFSVNKADSTTVTALHNANHDVIPNGSSVPLGTIMHDSATVSGTGAGTPTGNVTFTFFANGTCSGDGIGAGTVNLVSGVAHPSNPTGALTAGSYAFRATYNGDTNYNVSTSGCEPFSVNKADSTTVTALHNANHDVIPNGGSVPLGTIMHDSATVSGTGAGTPTGNVTFTFFANGTCSGDGIGAGTVNLVSGVAHPSNPTGALTAGSYAFRATYNGDTNYNVSTSGCEPFSVNKADSTTVTTLHNANHDVIPNGGSVPLGTIMHDSATVSGTGAGTPTGNVTFTFFANGTCDR